MKTRTLPSLPRGIYLAPRLLARKPLLPTSYGVAVLAGYFIASIIGGAAGAYLNSVWLMALGTLAPQAGCLAHLMALRMRYR